MAQPQDVSEILVLGAHTATGEAVWEALDDRDLTGRAVRATTTAHVGPGLDLIDPAQLGKAHVALLCFDDPTAVTLAEAADRLPCPLVDVAGVLGPGEAPLVLAALGDPVPASGPMRVPLGLTGPLIAIVRALAPFEPTAAQIVTLEGAAGLGTPGMDELSAQTRAVFTGQEAPIEVLGAALAFGIHAGLGDGPGAAEHALAADLVEGTGSELAVRCTRLRVPVFTAEGAVVELTLRDPPDERPILTDRLDGASGLRVVEGTMGTLAATDRDDALVGRLDLRGDRVRMFVAADRVRAGAAAPAVAVAAQRVES